jgi:hypothetical protein
MTFSMLLDTLHVFSLERGTLKINAEYLLRQELLICSQCHSSLSLQMDKIFMEIL